MKRILVPYDFDEGAELALDTAAQWAAGDQAHIYVLHVLSAPALAAINHELAWRFNEPETVDELEQKHLEALRSAIEKSGLKAKQATPVLLKGGVWQRIMDFGVQEKVDLMIIGETDNTLYLGDRFFSTLTDRIVHKSRIPVLVVKSKVELDNITRLALADDLSEPQATIEKVLSSRDLFDAKVEVVRINTPSNFMNDVYFDYKVKEVEALRKLNCSYHSFNYESVADGLIYFAYRRRADMLVVGGKHRSTIRRWFLNEDLAEQVMDFSDIPVLILD